MQNELDAISLPKRILVRVLVVVALYPILLGGVANMQMKYRARWMQMRQEHRAALDRDRARRDRIMKEVGYSEGSRQPVGASKQ